MQSVLGGGVRSTGHSVQINLPRRRHARDAVRLDVPQWSNAIERDRARVYFIAYSAATAFYFLEKALELVHAGETQTFQEFEVPDEAIGCGFHEAVRGVLSHHLVIRDGKIANYHPYPLPVERSLPTIRKTGPYRTRSRAARSSRERPRQV